MPIIEGGRILFIQEKPQFPRSNYAVTGIYLYDTAIWDILTTLTPSGRGELEVTDVNNAYIDRGVMEYDILDGWWGDAGESIETYSETFRFLADRARSAVLHRARSRRRRHEQDRRHWRRRIHRLALRAPYAHRRSERGRDGPGCAYLRGQSGQSGRSRGTAALPFVHGNIADPMVDGAVLTGQDVVVNFAAETHVDRRSWTPADSSAPMSKAPGCCLTPRGGTA